jgi:alginate O-acetyltransferase complex protein AlgI
MLFNSFEFLLFFPIVTALYFLLPHNFRWFHLLVASCIFYMYFIPIYILVLFLTIIIDYIAGIMIENAKGARRKWFLVMSIFANVGVLAVFKYYNFFIDNINEFFHITNINAHLPIWNIILPIGLSFHTFQAMSYTIEVYRGQQKAEPDLGIYALYVMFYPQLVAGPIERPQNLLPHFHEKHDFKYENAAIGFRLMMWGMIKKVVIADRLALTTDPIFKDPHHHSGTALAIATIFFAFQIFCDFSGYSDIATGAARVMGFKLMTNFNKPYHSRSISEFWKRWHISLSTWFKDYLYISLGGNRVSVPRMYFNLFFVFMVSGFWHGANWTFIAWGALHGFYLVFALFTKGVREKVANTLGITKFPTVNNTLNIITTFILVNIAWVFFRAVNIHDALYIVRKFTSVPGEMLQVATSHHIAFLNLPGIYNAILPGFGLIAFLEIAHIIQHKYDLEHTFSARPTFVRWSLYFGGQAALFFLGVYQDQQFIYFQF